MKNLKKVLTENGISFCPEKEIKNRINKLTLYLQKENIPAAIIFSKVNNYYFTGTNQEQFLIIYADKAPLLLVKRDLERASLESPIETKEIKSLKNLKEFISEKRIGLEFNYISANQFIKLQSIFNSDFIDITKIISEIRSIKSNYEVGQMRKAGEIANRVYTESLNFLKEGLTEIEFGSIMFSLALKYGHEGILRTSSVDFSPVSWHILSGISGNIHGQYDAPASGIGLSTSFPNSASRKKIKKHEPIMVDFGICYSGYQVDSTRMYCIGEPSEKFYFYYEKAKEIEKVVLDNLKEKVDSSYLFSLAVEKAKELKVVKEFLGVGKNKKRFIGHGVGLETSELPIIAKNFRGAVASGNTIAVEPKFVVEDLGIIGIENTIYFFKNNWEKLTKISEDILTV